jgi:pimeloyl-ACP methyl ester carboxylesterase
MSDAVESFRVDVGDDVLDDLRTRLARVRLPDQLAGVGWDAGVPTDWLAELVAYWRDSYDWRAAEAELNAYEHVRTVIDGQPVHCLHARSPHPDATPLLLIHGWPGSIVEFLDVIPRLTHPEDHGGDPADAVHVVAPSLPGYGFSGPTLEPGWDPARIARAFATLMARLGHDAYVAQGGDWGAQVGTRLAALDPHCIALHTNMPIASPPKDKVELSAADREALAALARFRDGESGYALEQSTKPQTLGVALNDSPAGLLAWIVEKFRTWSDCGGDVESVLSRDRLLTNVMLYWVTGTITSSARLYWERQRSDDTPGFVAVPTGIARYPAEILRYPRPWVELAYHVTYWNELPRGGHFAAMEQPALFADDLRAFLRTLA